MAEGTDDFVEGVARDEPPEERLLVAQDAYEGPLDLLLDLVRSRKVDISAISILQVIDSFFEWMSRARDMRLELAADWLVMMATLCFLKSKLLLPSARDDSTDRAQGMIEDLALRLRRTEAMRAVVEDLQRRPRLGIHWFAMGREPEPEGAAKRMEAKLHNLLVAYYREARHTVGRPPAPVRKPFQIFSVEEAIAYLRSIGIAPDVVSSLRDLLPPTPPGDRMLSRSRVASTYVASLEMAKRGEVYVQQDEDGVWVTVRGRGEAA